MSERGSVPWRWTASGAMYGYLPHATDFSSSTDDVRAFACDGNVRSTFASRSTDAGDVELLRGVVAEEEVGNEKATG